MSDKLYKFLFEQDEDLGDAPEGGVKVDTQPKARKADDSVDDQIDSLILLYEKRAIRDDEDNLMESLNRTSLKYLFEQEEEEPAEEEPAEESETEPTGSEEITTTAAVSEPVPDIDIDKFTIKIARLIMNHRQLLDVETAIINRTKNFLDENYGDKFVVRYLDVLEEQFGISAQEFDMKPVEDAPYAIGANPAGAGMSGG
tara:strand:+ start:11139 stop:11738 length:600 start_codon:yes stop_codon:yes gene_type:complete